MKMNPTLLAIKKAASKNEFISFDYKKEDSEEVTHRVVRFGSDIAKRLEKEGKPILGEKGRGNWIDGAQKSGLRSMVLRKNGKAYVRGTECTPGKPPAHKVFILSGIQLKK